MAQYDDDPNDLGKSIAKGIMLFGNSENIGKADPLPILKALQAWLGLGAQNAQKPQEQVYNPNANEAMRRAQIEAMLKQSQMGNPGNMAGSERQGYDKMLSGQSMDRPKQNK